MNINFQFYKTYKYNISRESGRPKSDSDASSVEADATGRPHFRKRLISRYESQDYDQIENALFLKEQEKGRTLVWSMVNNYNAQWPDLLSSAGSEALGGKVVCVPVDRDWHSTGGDCNRSQH